jgi:hypothetical protein
VQESWCRFQSGSDAALMRHVSIINLNANYFYLRFVYFG